MDTATITVSPNAICSGSIQISADNFSSCVPIAGNAAASEEDKVFTLIPHRPVNLKDATVYKIRVTTAAKDKTANAVAANFTTATGFTTTTCPEGSMPAIDGQINAMVQVGCTLYVGGNFKFIGGRRGHGHLIKADNGSLHPVVNPPVVQGRVLASVSDGAGGFFIAGNFTRVNGELRNKIARLNADGSLNAWRTGLTINDQINTMIILDNILYIGGNFTTVGANIRNRLAAFSVADGGILAWAPAANNQIRTLLGIGTTIYAGGDFTQINGTPRTYIAAIGTNGALSAVNPVIGGAGSSVNTIAARAGTLYFGGNFTNVNGTPRSNLAAIAAADGALQAWGPEAILDVNKLFVVGDTVFMYGLFFSINDIDRFGVAAVGIDGTLKTWYPNAGTIFAVDNTFAYFSGLEGEIRAVRLDDATIAWTSTAQTSETADTISVSGTNLFLGGNFRLIGGTARKALAAVSTDGTIQTWNPNVSGGSVEALALSNSAIYAGGNFTQVSGNARDRLAAFDVATGNLRTWNPGANQEVKSIRVASGTVYVGGGFSQIASTSRNYLAAIDENATLLNWNPNANGSVNSMALHGNRIFVGGEFNVIAGTARNGRVAELSTTGNLQTFNNPAIDNPVDVIYPTETNLHVLGNFATIGGNSRERWGKLNITSGALSPGGGTLNFDLDGVTAASRLDGIVHSGSNIYLGGHFTSYGAHARRYLISLDENNGVTTWAPTLDGRGKPLLLRGNSIYVSGAFSHVNGTFTTGFARINVSDGAL
jgi:trimeric autotransporter adhesin